MISHEYCHLLLLFVGHHPFFLNIIVVLAFFIRLSFIIRLSHGITSGAEVLNFLSVHHPFLKYQLTVPT
jgi:hypothetical protein